MKWPTTKEEHAYMKKRQNENKKRCLSSRAESWMKQKLEATDYKWKRQAQWGYRLFDFWCHELGVAIEVDGPEHQIEYDAVRDKHNFDVSGIWVIRIKNFDDKTADRAIDFITNIDENWNDRRRILGLNPILGIN